MTKEMSKGGPNPFDAATGYTVGELRGAVSIKQPLDSARDHPVGK